MAEKDDKTKILLEPYGDPIKKYRMNCQKTNYPIIACRKNQDSPD